MSISAQDVKKLREMTNAGIMDCKKALQETDGDFEAAVEWLQVKGITKAGKKADRVAAEGVIGLWTNEAGTEAVLVEVNSETDFVARNEGFQAFVREVTDAIGNSTAQTVEDLEHVTVNGVAIPEYTVSKIATIGENIKVRRIARLSVEEGTVSTYIHAGDQIGVLVKVEGRSDDEAKTFGRDIAMHAAAMRPTFLSSDEVDEDVAAKQREIFEALVREEGKPEKIVPKIVDGKMRKWAQEGSLLDQAYVKNPDLSVRQHQDEVGGVRVTAFFRLEVGEGIEKQEDNLADEVAKLQG